MCESRWLFPVCLSAGTSSSLGPSWLSPDEETVCTRLWRRSEEREGKVKKWLPLEQDSLSFPASSSSDLLLFLPLLLLLLLRSWSSSFSSWVGFLFQSLLGLGIHLLFFSYFVLTYSLAFFLGIHHRFQSIQTHRQSLLRPKSFPPFPLKLV